MKSGISRTAAALAFSLFFSSSAWAGCTLSDVAGKTWMASATELSNQVLFFCKLSINIYGTVASQPNGCSDYYSNQSNFNSPSKYNVKSGSVKLVSPADCTFEANLKLDDGSTMPVARFVLDFNKTVGVGNFIVNWGGRGPFNMVRLQ